MLSNVVQSLNSSLLKQSIKHGVMGVTVGCGLIEVGVQLGLVRPRFRPQSGSRKMIVWSGRAALMAALLNSPPARYLIQKAVNQLISQKTQLRLFGPAATFRTNWSHPRHVANLALWVAALPAASLAIVDCKQRPRCYENWVPIMTLWVLLTHRTTQHGVNAALRALSGR